MENYFQCGRYRLPLREGERPLVMGVLNATPDSFSDGGQYLALESALSRAEQMIAEGVDIIDIGGETTRPGAKMLPLEQELQRVMPLVYALRDCGKPLSIDTYKPQVMREALAAGADMINDINGFRAEGAVDAVKGSDCGLCVMHMQNQPQNMQDDPHYADMVDEVTGFLRERVAVLQAADVSRSRICIDPGFGFGKTLSHNLALLKGIASMQEALDLPLLAGMSRKSMLGAITGQPVEKRLAASLAAALVATANGARILRVHDVAETIDALAVWQAAMR
ncbi:dihydropteroate synthase [Herminiimonas sp. CN]|uniref:dihydropteroate synthase n=1 Tax=Herminiimonas sp. CN TaxID=1349818 RepID=UPI000473DECA|nr:dihydropteroate synthase [Herminiimonas sp. CN]